MKTDPTKVDREAANLFTLTPGMRAWFLHDGTPSRILSDSGKARWEQGGVPFAVETSGPLGIDAIDTDDPATVGCMLAQVRAEYGRPRACTSNGINGRGHLMWCVVALDYPLRWKRTEGAALVAAMKAIKEWVTK